MGSQQVPLTHTCPVEQLPLQSTVPPQPSLIEPHCPVEQVVRGVQQALLYSTCPEGHRHVPDWQPVPPLHAVEQLPQWLLSDWVFTHEVPHTVCEHCVEQLPPEQVWPLGHEFPHPLQLLPSVRVSTHLPLQFVKADGQVHFPALHEVPPLQTVPQALQLLLSVVGSMHWPLQ